MAFRIALTDGSAAFEAGAGETVLGAALRAGVDLPHACTLGGCGTCRVRVIEGTVGYDTFPLALSPQEAEEGYALACQAQPMENLVIEVPRVELAVPQRQQAMVVDIEPYGAEVTHLSIVLPELASFAFRPGQHMNVFLEDGSHRSFSMASVPEGNALDFHIRRIAGGRFTDTALGTLQPGDMLDVELPHGTFRYHEEDYRQLVMVATGTGLAPIKCILESLMDDPDCPPVSLYWGMRTQADLYLQDEIAAWRERLYDFRYVPVLSRADGGWEGRRGHVQQAVLEDIPRFEDHAIYLCGSPRMIRDAKRDFGGAGASVDHVYVDGFNFQGAAGEALSRAAAGKE